jgi:cell division protein FtsB
MARTGGRRSPVVRLARRVAGALALVAVVALGAIAFAGRIEQNVALSHELAQAQHEVHDLRVRRAEETRDIRRLRGPDGVVPYIYRRLRMVKPGETLIYVVTPAPSSPPLR